MSTDITPGLVLFVMLDFHPKTKNKRQQLGTTKTNKVCQGFRAPLGYGFVCWFVFPCKTLKTKKHRKKQKKNKENQRKPKKH